MIQKDLQTERTKPDSIGMGSYNSDSHHVQRFVDENGNAINEGDMQVPVQPYEISYLCLTPKSEECENFLSLHLFCITRCLLLHAHGTAVHDYRAGCRSGGKTGD